MPLTTSFFFKEEPGHNDPWLPGGHTAEEIDTELLQRLRAALLH